MPKRSFSHESRRIRIIIKLSNFLLPNPEFVGAMGGGRGGRGLAVVCTLVARRRIISYS